MLLDLCSVSSPAGILASDECQVQAVWCDVLELSERGLCRRVGARDGLLSLFDELREASIVVDAWVDLPASCGVRRAAECVTDGVERFLGGHGHFSMFTQPPQPFAACQDFDRAGHEMPPSVRLAKSLCCRFLMSQ